MLKPIATQRRKDREAFEIARAVEDLAVGDRPHVTLWYSLGQEDSHMPHVELDVPDEVLLSLKERADEFARDVKLLAAVKLFELGKLSSGRAAQLAGLSRVEFLLVLGKYRVSPFQTTAEELDQDLLNA